MCWAAGWDGFPQHMEVDQLRALNAVSVWRKPESAGQAGQGRQAQRGGLVHGECLQLGALLLHEGPVRWIRRVHVIKEPQRCQRWPAAGD